MIRRPPRSTQSRSSAASDVYKRQAQRPAAGLAQPAQESLPEEAVVAERAEAREHRRRHREREHVGRQVAAHGDVSPPDRRLRLVEVAKGDDQLHAARAEGDRDRIRLPPGVMVVGAVLEHAELVRVDPERDRPQVGGELRLEGPDEYVAVLGPVRRGVVDPAGHELPRGAQTLVAPEEVDEIVALAGLHAEEGAAAAAAAKVVGCQVERLALEPATVEVEHAGAPPGTRFGRDERGERVGVGGVVEADQRSVQRQLRDQAGRVGLRRVSWHELLHVEKTVTCGDCTRGRAGRARPCDRDRPQPGRSGQEVEDEGARLTIEVRWRARAAPVDAQGEADAEGDHGRDGDDQQDQSHVSAMRVHVLSIPGLTPRTWGRRRQGTTNRALLPDVPALTSRRASMRSRNSLTWETMPTSRPPSLRLISELIARSRDSSSSEPKPSSTNTVSRRMPPAWAWTTSASPRASESAAMNFSPPESVVTGRATPVQASYTRRPRPAASLRPLRSSVRSRA